MKNIYDFGLADQIELILDDAFNVKIDNMNDSSITMDSIKKMKVSWGADLNGSDVSLANYVGGEVKYPKIGGSSRPANPPTIAVGIVQSEAEFDMNDLMNVKEGRTDSAMVYLTPVTTSPQKTNGKTDNYTGTEFKNGSSQISKSSMVKSNDRVHKNLPFGVACPYAGESEFACSVEIELPEPVDSNGNGVGVRGDDNFTVALLLPYGVTTDVMVEFFCEDGKVCGVEKSICEEGEFRINIVFPFCKVRINLVAFCRKSLIKFRFKFLNLCTHAAGRSFLEGIERTVDF